MTIHIWVFSEDHKMDDPLHTYGSVSIIDALHHGYGNILSYCESEPDIDSRNYVVTKQLPVADVSRTLHEFSIWCHRQLLALAGEIDKRDVSSGLAKLDTKQKIIDAVDDDELEAIWAHHSAISTACEYAGAWARRYEGHAIHNAEWNDSIAVAAKSAWVNGHKAWGSVRSDYRKAIGHIAKNKIKLKQEIKLEGMVLGLPEFEYQSKTGIT